MLFSSTHHGDVEGVEKVKGQRRHQVHEEPGGGVVDADGARVVHHLARLTHVGGAEVQDDVCRGEISVCTHTHRHTNAHIEVA